MKNTWLIALLGLLLATGAFAPAPAWAAPNYGAAGAASRGALAGMSRPEHRHETAAA